MLPLLLYGALMMTVDGRDQGKEKWPQRKLLYSFSLCVCCQAIESHQFRLSTFTTYISAAACGCERFSWVFFFTKEKEKEMNQYIVKRSRSRFYSWLVYQTESKVVNQNSRPLKLLHMYKKTGIRNETNEYIQEDCRLSRQLENIRKSFLLIPKHEYVVVPCIRNRRKDALLSFSSSSFLRLIFVFFFFQIQFRSIS